MSLDARRDPQGLRRVYGAAPDGEGGSSSWGRRGVLSGRVYVHLPVSLPRDVTISQ